MKGYAILVLALAALVAAVSAIPEENVANYIRSLDKDSRAYVTELVTMVRRMDDYTSIGFDYKDMFYDYFVTNVLFWYKPTKWQIGAGNAFKKAMDWPCVKVREAAKLIIPENEHYSECIDMRLAVKACDFYEAEGPKQVKKKWTKELKPEFLAQQADKQFIDMLSEYLVNKL